MYIGYTVKFFACMFLPLFYWVVCVFLLTQRSSLHILMLILHSSAYSEYLSEFKLALIVFNIIRWSINSELLMGEATPQLHLFYVDNG